MVLVHPMMAGVRACVSVRQKVSNTDYFGLQSTLLHVTFHTDSWPINNIFTSFTFSNILEEFGSTLLMIPASSLQSLNAWSSSISYKSVLCNALFH